MDSRGREIGAASGGCVALPSTNESYRLYYYNRFERRARNGLIFLTFSCQRPINTPVA